MKFIETDEGKFVNLNQVKFIQFERFQAQNKETLENLSGDLCVLYLDVGVPLILFPLQDDFWDDGRIDIRRKNTCLLKFIEKICNDDEEVIGHMRLQSYFADIYKSLKEALDVMERITDGN
jgi:hypothetical protein